jgi:orotate phosphoribosyltransferase
MPCVFVRKEAKAYGTEKAVEGPLIKGKRATIIEDVVTTGGAIIDAVATFVRCRCGYSGLRNLAGH